ncbi:DUF4892 domain-containing protein [Humitalea sp. 24SJ18S-53]|uniref:OmpA family protein n=1 Tax=Humitalea sp. 24SJ18S-53 TaxID=3422307 RepID=UPI003D67CE9F
MTSLTKGFLALAGALLLTLGTAEAQPRPAPAPTDLAGSRDHPLVGRYQGSTIRLSRVRDYDEFRMVTGRVTSADTRQHGSRRHEGNSLAVAGRAVRMTYVLPASAGRSALEVVRNFQERLTAQGFEIVFACAREACGNPSDLWFAVSEAVPIQAALGNNWGDLAYVMARLVRPREGDVFVSILASPRAGNDPQLSVLVDVVEARPMQTGQIAFVDASAMQQAIERSGRIALYGIQFGFDSAEITAESRPTLQEVATYLRANPTLSVVVTGHTDAQGAFDYNVDLSRRRAQAVVATLARDFAIAPARLTAFGAGMAAPVASNASDAGRAENRRVEIVRR